MAWLQDFRRCLCLSVFIGSVGSIQSFLQRHFTQFVGVLSLVCATKSLFLLFGLYIGLIMEMDVDMKMEKGFRILANFVQGEMRSYITILA